MMKNKDSSYYINKIINYEASIEDFKDFLKNKTQIMENRLLKFNEFINEENEFNENKVPDPLEWKKVEKDMYVTLYGKRRIYAYKKNKGFRVEIPYKKGSLNLIWKRYVESPNYDLQDLNYPVIQKVNKFLKKNQ